MTGTADPLQEAVAALLAAGHTVELIGDDFALWLVDGGAVPYSDDEVIAYARTLGLIGPPTAIPWPTPASGQPLGKQHVVE
jgi:hypothetical protein